MKWVGFHQLEIQNLSIEDQNKDSLIQIHHLLVDIGSYKNLDFKKHKIAIQQVSLDTAIFYLHREKNQKLNIDFILHYFGSDKKKGKSQSEEIVIQQVLFHNSHFKYSSPSQEKPFYKLTDSFHSKDQRIPIDFAHIDISNFNTFIRSFHIKGTTITAEILSMNFLEKSGFKLNDLRSQVFIKDQSINLNHFHLITPQSTLGDQLSLNFKDWSDFDDFTGKVELKANFLPSTLDSKDVQYFTSDLDRINFHVQLSGRGYGKIGSLKFKDLLLKTAFNTYVKGDYLVLNLNHPNNIFIQSPSATIHTTKTDLNKIFSNLHHPEWGNKIPKALADLADIKIEGKIEGSIPSLRTVLRIQTNLGQINVNMNLKNINSEFLKYRGTISSPGFQLGNILKSSGFNQINFESFVKGEGIGLEAILDTLTANVHYLDYRNYRYQNLAIQGNEHKKAFKGNIFIKDPNLNLTFHGLFDLNTKIPVFDFKAEISRADLRRLKFTKDSIGLKTLLDIHFSGNSLNLMQGRLLAHSTVLTNGSKEFSLDSILIGADQHGKEKVLFLKSCLGDIEIKGQYDFTHLNQEIINIIGKYLPSNRWVNNQVRIDNPSMKAQNFTFSASLKDLDPIFSIIDPYWKVAPGSILDGTFDNRSQKVSLGGYSPEITYKNFHAESLTIDGQNAITGNFNINLSVDSVKLGTNTLAKTINLSNTLHKDSLIFNLKVADVNEINHMDLNGLILLNNQKASLGILPSELTLKNEVWKIENGLTLGFDQNIVTIHGFKMDHEKENLKINGLISDNIKDTLKASFTNFELDHLNEILKQDGLLIAGNLTGTATISSVLNSPSIGSSLSIDSLKINNKNLGNAYLNDTWDGKSSILEFQGKIKNKFLNTIQLEGRVGLSDKNDTLNAILKMDRAEIALLEPFTKGIVSKLGGSISSELTILGKRSKPSLNGWINFNKGELTVDYLNTHYTFNDSVKIKNDTLALNNVILLDPFLNKGIIGGTIDFKKLNNPIFDADLHAVNFLSLNTNAKQGQEYYGKAFSTGDYSFVGSLDHMNIIIDAITEPNTTLNIPLNRTNSVNNNDYITFITIKDSAQNALKKKSNHHGINMDFNLTINPNANIKLIFDEKIGDVIQGSGNSDLNLQLTPEGDFLMFGTFEIEKGNYLFTSQNILDKLFTIEKGGNIRFNGEPLNADIDLFANYQSRAYVQNLYQAANVTSTYYNDNSLPVLVNSNIHLAGTLSDPTLNFALKFPQTPVVEQELATYLSSKDLVTTQSMLFLISNQFNGALSPSNGGAIAISTGGQYLSNQLTNILDNYSSKVDISIRSLQDYGFIYRAFNDRIQLSSNISTLQQQAQNNQYILSSIPSGFNKVTGDAELSYGINKDGSIRIKAFWRLVPVDFIQSQSNIGTIVDPNSEYTQGLGIVYRKEFNSLRDLFSKQNKDPKSTTSPLDLKQKSSIEIKDIKD